jgi:uncharacterized protein
VTAAPLAYSLAAGAGLIAGAVNAVAGGGTIVSFPALQAIGLPSLRANITNIVALTPGYFSGTHAQRADLEGQHHRLRALALIAAAGGLLGSVLLVVVSAATFKRVVPFLILLACAALLAQNRLRTLTGRKHLSAVGHSSASPAAGTAAGRAASDHPGLAERISIFGCSVYGGFFGAGLGIMLLGVLGLFSDAGLVRNNAVKQALSVVVNVIAATFLAFSGHVDWGYAGVMAGTSTVGGALGGRVVHLISPKVMRVGVVLLGCAVAIRYWV